MNNTPFNARSSEWVGDMTVWLRQNAEDNTLQLERMRRNLRRARETELTPRQQHLLQLYYEQNLSMTEIADLLHINVSTVSRTLQRAKSRLHHYLQYTL